MSDDRTGGKADTGEQIVAFQNPMGIGGAAALALRRQRVAAGLAIRDLGRASGVSSAMISRIENAQVSPSLSTLEALARALSVPVISFFQHTVQTADIHFVKAGEGLAAKRFAPDHVHDYRLLAQFTDNALAFSGPASPCPMPLQSEQTLRYRDMIERNRCLKRPPRVGRGPPHRPSTSAKSA